jgi:ABC-type oligopeptide transport system ATPase subunit
MTIKPLIQVNQISKEFPIKRRFMKALSQISFNIYPGEVLGIVGESGSGKSTLGKLLVKILTPSEGDILFENQSLLKMTHKEIHLFRKNAQMIFQNPYSSLNPRMNARDIVEEPLKIYKIGDQGYRKAKVFKLLESVGLDPSFQSRYPHEFSGGQRQKLSIARTLSLSPKFIVCDEPTAALDVSIQAQIINLLKKLQTDLGLTYLFISHDLNVIRHICSRVMVIYYGQIVEIANTDELFSNPLHPYTQNLLSSIPIPDPKLEKLRLQKKKEEATSQKNLAMPEWHFSQNQINPPLKRINSTHYVQAV